MLKGAHQMNLVRNFIGITILQTTACDSIGMGAVQMFYVVVATPLYFSSMAYFALVLQSFFLRLNVLDSDNLGFLFNFVYKVTKPR